MPNAPSVSLEQLSVELFQSLSGQRFQVNGVDSAGQFRTVELELIEVLPLSRWRPVDGRQCFSIVFRGIAGPDLEPGLHCVEHAEMHFPVLLLNRISYSDDPRDRQAYYESIFN